MKPIYIIKTLANFIGKRGVVCGGCCRDMILDREPKDYDIFIFSENDIHKIAQQLKAKLKHHYTRGSTSIIYCTEIHGKEVQLVYGSYLGSNVKQVISGFPYTICQFWYDINTNQIDSTSLARKSIQDKTLIFNKQGHISGIEDKQTLRTFLILKGTYLAEKLNLAILPNSIEDIYKKYS